MPTAGRLAGAIAYALYGWYIASLLIPFFPEGVAPGYLIPATITIAVVCGWKIVGARANRGYYAAIGHGLTGAFALSFWVIFLVSFQRMIRKSLRRLYDGPMEGVVDIFAQMLEFGQELLDVNLIVSVAVGGVIGAWVAEYYAKRYP
ncbi:TrgA family protein [Yoonia sp.]|uniref:TrgA family protein n=1 Tax=Yoonia sp. TaxID=2212373 RepID=UPI001A0A1488|nr:TrgA family protein [Yoonia sp.]MBE0413911.1 TrgA family protein [Yoonia sp.]